jgi:hypothetical protein
MNQLVSSTKVLKKHADKAIVTIRLNGTSDLPLKSIRLKIIKISLNCFQMYNFMITLKTIYVLIKCYLKIITFSRSETNHTKSIEMLNRGFNVAMVFDKLPSHWGFEVINGDLDDFVR